MSERAVASGRRVFLTTRWTDVVLVNYAVPPELLRPQVPPGSELDRWEGAPDLYLLSLVALRFAGMRVMGLPIPTARDFAEVNLRFYVRRGDIRAAVFLREYVPARAVVLGARLWYQQPYHLATVTHDVRVESGTRLVHTRFAYRQQRGEIRLRAKDLPETPPTDSLAHFLKEHYWGIYAVSPTVSRLYQVEHPVWRTFPVESAEVSIDPGALLGGDWRSLDWAAARHSVVLAEGSAVSITVAEPLERH